MRAMVPIFLLLLLACGGSGPSWPDAATGADAAADAASPCREEASEDCDIEGWETGPCWSVFACRCRALYAGEVLDRCLERACQAAWTCAFADPGCYCPANHGGC